MVIATVILGADVPVFLFTTEKWFAIVVGGRSHGCCLQEEGVSKGTMPVGLLLVMLSGIAPVILIEVLPATRPFICLKGSSVRLPVVRC